MKTIQIADEIFERLIALAQEIDTQDNRGTGKPYLFQIQTDFKIWRGDLEGEHLVLINEDGDERGPFTAATIKAYCEDYEIDVPAWVDVMDNGLPYGWSDKSCEWDWNAWIDERKLRLVSYDIGKKLENGFLTAKGCQNHIRMNGYHYDNPKDYLSHCFRNPEMELIYTFLSALLPKP